MGRRERDWDRRSMITETLRLLFPISPFFPFSL
jgi:hypothetical protein